MALNNNKKKSLFIPGDVPAYGRDSYKKNFTRVTRKTNRFFMFAGDQKIEHLNADFYGKEIHQDALDPEHIFKIAQQGSVGALATHPGLIARYGTNYKEINYIAKLNGKTNLGASQLDPVSELLWDIDDVMDLATDAELSVCGIGYTIYLGSAYENRMLSQAAHIISHAHNNGLIAILWIYIRAAHIKHSDTPELIAGAAGIGNALGADFVKVHVPQPCTDETLSIIAKAAGNTGVMFSGGPAREPSDLLGSIYEQIHAGARGCAIGRNIFQQSLPDAVALTKAISAIVYEDDSLELAKQLLHT